MCGEDWRRFGALSHVTSSARKPAQTHAGAPLCRRQSRQWHQDTWKGCPAAANCTAPQKQWPRSVWLIEVLRNPARPAAGRDRPEAPPRASPGPSRRRSRPQARRARRGPSAGPKRARGNLRHGAAQRLVLLHADDGIVVAAHADVGHVGGAALQDAVVGGRHVRVRADRPAKRGRRGNGPWSASRSSPRHGCR